MDPHNVGSRARKWESMSPNRLGRKMEQDRPIKERNNWRMESEKEGSGLYEEKKRGRQMMAWRLSQSEEAE
jgi:hypothetical protein